jgi:hypothetical protein
MENKNETSKIEEPFNPDTVLNRLSEISNKISELVNSDKKGAIIEIRELNKEVIRLLKLRDDYYKSR